MACLSAPGHTLDPRWQQRDVYHRDTAHRVLKMLSVRKWRRGYSRPRKRTRCWQIWIWYTVWFLYMKKQTNWSLVMGRSHWCWVTAFSHRSSGQKSEGPVFKSICHHSSCLFLLEGGTRFWSQHIKQSRKELCDKTPLNGGIFQRLH